MWKVLNRGLPTNSFRARRGMSSSSLCPLCNQHGESSSHILRDYIMVHPIWEIFGNYLGHDFFTMDLQEWIESNIRGLSSPA